MDGTLLGSDGRVSEKSVKAINSLIDKGMIFSVATARSETSASELLKDIHMNAPAVLMNGVFIYDLKNRRAVKYFEIPEEILPDILHAFTRRHKSPFLFSYGDDNKMYIDYTALKLGIHKSFYSLRAPKLGGRFRKTASLGKRENLHPVFLSLSDEYGELKPIYDEVSSLEGVTASFYADTYTKYWFLEIYSSLASKRNGAETVKKLTGADEIAAFGDNLNDLLLFSGADRKYAVYNAVPELKNNCDRVIGSNDENGVAEFIKYDFKA